jgi:tubulin polyglutamylase TTLL5
VPIDESCIISRYVSNPFLINGLKFDLRIYVGITSMDPWRIYVYNEGLSRFAVDAYDDTNNRNAHLTNFSLNKKNEKFINNVNAEIDDMGHKWSIHGLNKHLEVMGIDMNLMWSRIYDVIIKSILCVDGHIQNGIKKLQHKNSCFEVLGFDVLMDSDLRPWLMEVNLSPSLATESPLDLKIKSGLFIDMMNLMCLRKFDRRKENLNKMKIRVKNAMRARSYQSR